MSHLTIAEVKRELTRVVAVELTPPSEHSGSQYLKSRYLQNGHITRLIESYARILAALQPNATVAVLGASPLEGFFLEKTGRVKSYSLLGSQDNLVYRSASDFYFTRVLDGSSDCQVYSVARLNLETSLPDKDESFDAVFCLEVLEHLRRDPLAFMNEIHRVLRPGGSLFLSTPNMNSARAITRALTWESPMFFPSFGPPPFGIIHAHEYSLFELLALVQASGLKAEEVDSFDHPQTELFNHDLAYRSRGLLDEETLVRLGVGQVETSQVESMLKGARHRGDYLFIYATRAGEGSRQPYPPLFCLFEGN
jgi:SAM-dependent methyltransferase